jgi:hypothetical protein
MLHSADTSSGQKFTINRYINKGTNSAFIKLLSFYCEYLHRPTGCLKSSHRHHGLSLVNDSLGKETERRQKQCETGNFPVFEGSQAVPACPGKAIIKRE